MSALVTGGMMTLSFGWLFYVFGESLCLLLHCNNTLLLQKTYSNWRFLSYCRKDPNRWTREPYSWWILKFTFPTTTVFQSNQRTSVLYQGLFACPNIYFQRFYICETVNLLSHFPQQMVKEPSRDKLLPEPLTYPYIQPPYTLVLEFTDMLVHPDWTVSHLYHHHLQEHLPHKKFCVYS